MAITGSGRLLPRSGAWRRYGHCEPTAKANLSYILAIGIPFSKEQNSFAPKALMSVWAHFKLRI
jgi:hypothetical protein